MHGFVLSKVDSAEIADLPDPEGSPDTVTVRMDALSICETDLKVISGASKTNKLPIILGHEGGGTVERVGQNVKGLRVGDHVLVDPNSYDYTCPQCRNGRYQLCENGGLMGREVDGLFAERVDIDDKHLYRVPQTFDSSMIPLLQPLSTVVHAHRKLEIMPGDVVAIIGLGPAGLMLSRIAECRGAVVVGIGRSKMKLELSKSFGVDHTISATEKDIIAEVREFTHGAGADVVIEATGDPGIFAQSLDLVKPGGIILQFGIGSANANFNQHKIYDKELTVLGTRSSVSSDFVVAINLAVSAKIDLEKLVTQRFKFSEMSAAIRESSDKSANLRVIVSP